MRKTYNRYTLIRHVIDAPLVGLSYILAHNVDRGGLIWGDAGQSSLFAILATVLWYVAASVSKLYRDRRSNKYSEEIVFIVYTLLLYAVLLSSVMFFLQKTVHYGSAFLVWHIGFLFVFLVFTKYIIRKFLHSALYQVRLYVNLLISGVTPASY